MAFVQLTSSIKGWFDGRRGFPSRYYAIPLILALIGMIYHVWRDWKFGLAFLTLFLTMGIALVVFFNMQNPQPRERDYFFVGSFFVFALWIGVGASGIIELITDAIKPKEQLWAKYKNVFVGGTAVVLFAVSPLQMFSQNLYSHNRNGNFAPFEYSYNILQSCKPDAILFTNGDNDTFPLWYLQEGMGIRQDVRIVNLSLVNTDWYILQLKNETPHGAMKVPISIPDAQIRNIGPTEWRTQTFKLSVPPEVYQRFGVTDTSDTNRGYIQYTISPTLRAGDIEAIRVQDIIMKNIVETNAWKRPVYYAVTVAPDNFIGLSPYLQMQGLALQLTPKMNRMQGEDYEINLPIMQACLMDPIKKESKEPQYGFLFTNLSNPNIFYDDNVRNLMVNYRYSYLRLAAYYQMRGDNASTIATLDTMEARIPTEVLPMRYEILSDISRLYFLSGAERQFKKFADVVTRDAKEAINENPNDVQRYYNPYRILLDVYEMERNFQDEINLLQSLQERFPSDRSIANKIAQLQVMMNFNKGSEVGKSTPDTSKPK